MTTDPRGPREVPGPPLGSVERRSPRSGVRGAVRSGQDGVVTVTVVQLSDTHLCAEPGPGRNGRDPDLRVGAVISALRRTLGGRSPQLVLLTGDLTDDGSEAGCRRLAGLLAPLGAPVVAVPGNHDLGPELEAVFGPPGPVEIGGWRVVAVSSRVPGRVEGASDPDTLLGVLDTAPAGATPGSTPVVGTPTILALHHPPDGPSAHPWFQLGGASRLLAGLAGRPQVRLVLSGHLHQPFERRRGRLCLLGAPSTLYAIRHQGRSWTPDDTVVCGARVLHLDPGGGWWTELVGIGPEVGTSDPGTDGTATHRPGW